MAQTNCTMHLIANTHWDREWHFTVEQTRPLLRDKMKAILDALDSDPDFSSFLLDGQSVILDDFMAICPEEKDRVARLIREGRLFAGPWYSLPDEFIVSGESVIRNIFMGHRVCAEFGGAMKVAYTPCSYGQISQMPQIWRGFGIDFALFYRGVRNDLTERVFRWEGADGSRIMVYRFGRSGRTDFFWQVLRPAVYDKARERTLQWDEPGTLFHLCDEASYRGDYALLDPPVRLIADERLAKGVARLKEDHFSDVPVREHLLFMVGSDCTAPHPKMTELVREVNRQIEPQGDRLVISSIPAYVDAFKRSIGIGELKTSLSGELHEAVKTSGSSLLESVVSMRIPLKQANEAAEVALQNWAEPAAAVAWGLGRPYPARFLQRAWKTLLACHPHDSICGVSIDAVCGDMMNRFREVRECSAGIAQESLSIIIKSIDLSDVAPGDVFLTVFNPLPWRRDAIVKAYIDAPAAPGKNPAVRLIGPSGEEAAVQHLSRRDAEPAVQHPDDMISLLPCSRFEALFEARDLPALGYRTYRVEASAKGFDGSSTLLCGARAMENEHLRVEIESNGTLAVTRKATGRVYRGLNAFEDGGDVGIGWNAIAPAKDRLVLSHACRAETAVVESGPLSAAFEIRLTMRVPKERSADGEGRSAEEVDLDILSRVTLRKGSPALDIETTVNNRARHHRLRALFPTGLDAQVVHAGGQFNVLERPIRKEDTTRWAERKHRTDPFHTFVDLSDGREGFAIAAQGLREYEAADNAERCLAITILRSVQCVTYLCAPEHEEMDGAQCLGPNTVRYALIPHAGRWDEAQLLREALCWSVPLKAAQHTKTNGALARELSFISLSNGNAVLSAMKKAEDRDAIVVRLYNPTGAEIETTLTSHFPLRRINALNLLEEPLAEAPLAEVPLKDERSATLRLPAKKILTLELVLAR